MAIDGELGCCLTAGALGEFLYNWAMPRPCFGSLETVFPWLLMNFAPLHRSEYSHIRCTQEAAEIFSKSGLLRYLQF